MYVVTKTNIMKKAIILLILSVFIFTSCDDNPGVSSAFLKYSHKSGVTTIVVPGWAIGLVSSFADLDREEKEILDCIDNVKVLTIEDNDLNARVNLHKEFYAKINTDNSYEELLAVRNGEEDITIFGKMNEDVITDLIVLVGGDDNAMVCVKGRIKVELINNEIRKGKHADFFSMKF